MVSRLQFIPFRIYRKRNCILYVCDTGKQLLFFQNIDYVLPICLTNDLLLSH